MDRKIVSGILLTLLLIGMLTLAFDIQPVEGDLKTRIVEHRITALELEKLRQAVGVREEGRKYNQMINGHGTGLRPPTEKEWVEIADKAFVVEKILLDHGAESPSSVDHTTGPWLPPIGDQGPEGSCVTWAVGYYVKTFQEAKDHGWDITWATWIGGDHGRPYPAVYRDQIFSPDFIYHQINDGTDGGSSYPDAIGLVCSIGICSWTKMPYDPDDSTSWPSEDAWREAPLYRGNSSGIEYLELNTNDDITSLKNWLASDHLAIISIDANQYDYLTSEDLWTLDTYNDPSLNHANTIVGYDDDIEYMEQGKSHYGAFKVANSWGTGGWENIDDGCLWISYEAMKQRVGECMFYRDRIDYDPKLVAAFSVDHPQRGECDITFGIGNKSAPVQTKRFDDWISDGGKHPFCSNDIVLDITEFEDSVPSVMNQPLFMQVFDGGVPSAHSGVNEWYSDGESYSWFRLGQTFDIPETGASLKFWSYYEIERDWDYGYVEVHDLETDEWYTMPSLTTISTLPERQDNPNCPENFEPTDYYDAGRWHAFTGFSGGWCQEEMYLTYFAGHTIELYFTYWTDPYELELGWYIDDIEIPEIGFFDDAETGPNAWIYSGWYITTAPPPITGTILSFSIEYYHNYSSGSLNVKSASHDVPVNTTDQDYVFAELMLKNVWTVDDDGPADFHTIQGAITAASDGDTIYVYNGTYYENVVVNKTLSLVGENQTVTIIDGNGTGTVVEITAGNVIITGLTIQNSGTAPHPHHYRGIYVSSGGNNISHNIITNNSYGIELWESSGNTITGNHITNNEYGISLYQSSNNVLRSNSMTDNHYNFGVSGASLSEFVNDIDVSNIVDGKPVYYWINRENVVVPLDAGYVALVNCTSITVENLNLTKSGQGILVAYTTNSTITKNNLTNNYDGIWLWASSNNNSLYGNNLANNGDGIGLSFSSNNSISGNNLTNNYHGIWLVNSSHNKFYHNDFMYNTYHVYIDTPGYTNFWDDVYPSGGNYWSDYGGANSYSGPYQNETGSDGIGDTSYFIDANNTDNYPLVSPYEYWSNPIPGDINKDTKVNYKDLFLLSSAYGSTPEDPNWNPHTDLNSDDEVNYKDLFILSSNYGEEWTYP